MRVLITTTRMPFAVDEIRKFDAAGHTVIAADTFSSAAGSHASGVAAAVVIPSPRRETSAFIDKIGELVDEHMIDLIVPAFEEVFYLARHRDQLGDAQLFAPEFGTLLQLHDKAGFNELCESLGLPVPPTVTVTTRAGLERATREFDRYFARAAFSRGGVEVLTNTGPLAESTELASVDPAEDSPWIVQKYLDGVDLCSFSVVRDGRIWAHCAYEHPKTIEHAGGIQFVSINEPATLRHAEEIAAATGYTGQLSLDHMRTADGVYLIECNPRPTLGVALMQAEEIVPAIVAEKPPRQVVAEAGRKCQLDLAMLRDMLYDWRSIPGDLKDLMEIPDVYADGWDIGPLVYAVLSYGRIVSYRAGEGRHVQHRSVLAASQFFDVEYDGGEIG